MDSKWLVGIGVGLVAAASLVAVGAGDRFTVTLPSADTSV